MFKVVSELHGSRFNTIDSCDFLDTYEQILNDNILKEEARQPSKTFAPSQLRCKRISWFRLRGVSPEVEEFADKGLNFTATIGTALHTAIQHNLSEYLEKDWIDVADYLVCKNPPYKYQCTRGDYETLVEIQNPPVKFAPDGLIRYKGKVRLLEIKSSDHTSFEKLSAPKPQHVDQVKTYATLLDLDDCLMLYVDRQYGNYKCFEVGISDDDKLNVWNTFTEVMHCVETNIAPPRLPSGDVWCNPSRCRYFYKCKEW